MTLEPIEGAALFPPAVSDDGLVYTFTIRDEATWSNGDPVTAADFIRGWRRGMEPGIATDYAFLFTDHIQGASKYVRWRRDAVAALTALSRLREGWGVDREDVEALVRHPIWKEIPGHSALEADREHAADKLASLDVDWVPLYDRVFRQHVEQFDAAFKDVGIEAPSPKTLVVTLTSPCAYFLDLTAFPTLSPCHESIERLRERRNGAPITAEGLVVYDPQWTKPDYHRNGYPGLITNGSYRLARWRFKRRARLEVNPFFQAQVLGQCLPGRPHGAITHHDQSGPWHPGQRLQKRVYPFVVSQAPHEEEHRWTPSRLAGRGEAGHVHAQRDHHAFLAHWLQPW